MTWLQVLGAMFTTINLILPELLKAIYLIIDFFKLKNKRLADAFDEEMKIKVKAAETQQKRETDNLAAYMLIITLGEKQTFHDLVDLLKQGKEPIILSRFLRPETLKHYDKVNEILYSDMKLENKAMEIHKIMNPAMVAS